MRRILIFLSVVCLMGPQYLFAQSDDIPVVLMMPFDNATAQQGFDSLKNGIPDLLTAFLSPYQDKVTVIDRGVMEGIFAEKSLSWEGLSDEKSLSQLGKLAQARYVIRGSVSGNGDSLRINAFVYETETTRLLKSFEGVDKANHLTHLIQEIASDIAGYFKTDMKDVKDLEELPLEEDPAKNLNFIYGLGYYHSGQSELALTYFMKILGDHPEDELAHYWLGKSFLQAGMGEHAKIEFKKYLKRYPQGEKKEDVARELK